jgi:uncharacterized protein (TIGR03085 family)
MTTPVSLERRRLAELMDELGPDAPTLCEGWDVRDLAAHLVLRERRPDAAGGILIGKLASYTERVQTNIAAGDWIPLIEQVRSGPPFWSPARIDRVDRVVNTLEFFVHHEDVRRAQPDWMPRDISEDLADDLYDSLRRGARLLGRGSKAGVTLEPDGGRGRIIMNDDEPMVIVRGPVGELVLWIHGRKTHANVQLDGSDEAIEAVSGSDDDA